MKITFDSDTKPSLVKRRFSDLQIGDVYYFHDASLDNKSFNQLHDEFFIKVTNSEGSYASHNCLSRDGHSYFTGPKTDNLVVVGHADIHVTFH